MEGRQHYKTRQREQIAAYLCARPGQHVTAAEVCAHFARQGVQMGKATVYRHLDRMVEEGLVTRYTVDGSTGACYAYTGPGPEPAEPACYHCKCQQCGALIHLHCDEVQHLRLHMLDHHGFALDPRRTVFYGICEACRAARRPMIIL